MTDRAAWLGLAVVGAGTILGTLLGACYAGLRVLAGVMDGDEEALL